MVTLRLLECSRCSNHGETVDAKGHKHVCKWRDCTCRDCVSSAVRGRNYRSTVRSINGRQQARKARQARARCTSPPSEGASSGFQDGGEVAMNTQNEEGVDFEVTSKGVFRDAGPNVLAGAQPSMCSLQGLVHTDTSAQPDDSTVVNEKQDPVPTTNNETDLKAENSNDQILSSDRSVDNKEIDQSERYLNLLCRLYPNQSRRILQLILKGCDNDIVVAIESVLPNREHVFSPNGQSANEWAPISWPPSVWAPGMATSYDCTLGCQQKLHQTCTFSDQTCYNYQAKRCNESYNGLQCIQSGCDQTISKCKCFESMGACDNSQDRTTQGCLYQSCCKQNHMS